MKYLAGIFLLILVLLGGCAGGTASSGQTTEKATLQASGEQESEEQREVSEEEEYTSKEDVALYLHLFGHLPDNFITKKEARELGWVSKEGNLGKVAPGKSIGGDYFGNYEGLLPEKKEETTMNVILTVPEGTAAQRGSSTPTMDGFIIPRITTRHLRNFIPGKKIQSENGKA